MIHRAGLAIVVAATCVLASGAPADAAFVGPDHYLCYRAALAKGQPAFPKGLSKVLDDRIEGARAFGVTKITTICNPADRDGSGTAHPSIHLEGFAIKK